MKRNWNKFDSASRYFATKQPKTSPTSNPRRKEITSSIIKKNSTVDDDEKSAARTTSFKPLRDKSVLPHTLILGTHPSIASLQGNRYYDFPMNAFWWIAGDCLGFRRGKGLTKAGKPYKFVDDLRYGEEKIISYEEQVDAITSRGFALWDVIESCERKGSLDQDIKKEKPNRIRELCKEYPSIRRIVLANGTTGSSMFLKHFREWFETGELYPGQNEESIKAFKKYSGDSIDIAKARIQCISATSVSPANARMSYVDKRTFWEKHVYKPGLADHESLSS